MFLSGGALVHAQAYARSQPVPPPPPWWYTLEEGKNYFRSGAYASALISFEDARRRREERFTRYEQDMILIMSMPEVRRLGDSLEYLEWYIETTHRTEAAAALQELYYRVPKQNLRGLASRALEEFDRLKAYPEAEYWLGESYRVEGELSLAINQYRKAYSHRDLLEVPDFAIEILYKLAQVHRQKQEYQEMENSLLDILRQKSGAVSGGQGIYWIAEGNSINAAMLRTLANNGIDRFLLLYRNDNAQVEYAHRLLGLYYYAAARHEPAAEHLMFSFLIQNTLLINEARRQMYNYEYTTLDDLMRVLSRRTDLIEWMDSVEYYRTAYYLAASLFATGRPLPAQQIWTFVAGRTEAGEWQGKSAVQLASPFIERAIEQP